LRSRPIIFTAALACVALAGVPAQAGRPQPKPKPKPPVCNLIVDEAGDATGTGIADTSTPSSDANLDIISADIASNATTVTAVVRLSALSASDQAAPTGQKYTVSVSVGESQLTLQAQISPMGNSFGTSGGVKGSGVVDEAAKEVRISAALADLPVKIPPGTPMTALAANSYRSVGTTDVVLGRADNAASTKSYVAAYPSCVKVGS
jgi:hypothetical protein